MRVERWIVVIALVVEDVVEVELLEGEHLAARLMTEGKILAGDGSEYPTFPHQSKASWLKKKGGDIRQWDVPLLDLDY